VISVLRESIPEWQGDWGESYWEWKFERNPHGDALIWVGDDDGRIAGCYIWNPVRIRVGAKAIRGAQSVDAATHTDYRGQGLFTDLARTAAEDVAESDLALVYAFPVEAAFRGQVRIGFETRWTVTPMHRPLLTPPMRRRVDDFALGRSARFDSEFDAFTRQERDGELRVDRDPDYLRWRYDQHPTLEYDTLVCHREGELCGYCVLSIESEKRIGRGFILDLEVRPDAEAAAAFLVHHALKHLRSRGARVAITWPRPSGPEQEALVDHGFSSRYRSIQRRLRRVRYRPQFLVYETATYRELMDGAGPESQPPWSLVPGDHDSN
jgi:GNAT superfamily N-acetyltransferase